MLAAAVSLSVVTSVEKLTRNSIAGVPGQVVLKR